MKPGIPEPTFSTNFFVQRNCASSLQFPDHLAEVCIPKLHEKVEMIWHYNPAKHFRTQNHFRVLQISCHEPCKNMILEPRDAFIRCNRDEIDSVRLRKPAFAECF